MFVRDCWYVAAFSHELVEQPLPRTLLGEPVVLFRSREGQAVALEDRCCHRGLPLAHGEVVAEGIQCGYHGLVYDCSGRCVRIPNQDTIPAAARVTAYPLRERDGLVWIWLGDAARAESVEPLAYPWHSAPGWAHKGKRNEVAAPHGLVIDNLLDLTHVGFVHKHTIGGMPATHSNAETKTSRTDHGLRMVRWMRDSVPPPTYVAVAGFQGRVDRWTEVEFQPGYVTINACAKDVGTGAYEGKHEGAFSLRSLHAVTPETEHSTHYFWTISHQAREGRPELTERVYNEIDATFAEDKVIIEAQFQRLQQKPQPPLLDLKADATALQARRIISLRIEQEGARAR
ncbi:aromatic ring-hydroxylating dioxygenase subunit alpha [Ramlibacter sp. G-1-2-2]|uniref:Aromatic ring-hydroxylating dioxygenase subunit alpha n=1 Tax=Ramlibacter agri TaxID=2728837 RepID=A0A848H0B9_9BURK|nr:aromatic ring-hydroxylating dioxygenase subunit alpha [Ramlibacter agri]NML43897.1 aromatic ring-hydroxylating dioxygenase subunit alpha [Ramlibacter agri]